MTLVFLLKSIIHRFYELLKNSQNMSHILKSIVVKFNYNKPTNFVL